MTDQITAPPPQILFKCCIQQAVIQLAINICYTSLSSEEHFFTELDNAIENSNIVIRNVGENLFSGPASYSEFI